MDKENIFSISGKKLSKEDLKDEGYEPSLGVITILENLLVLAKDGRLQEIVLTGYGPEVGFFHASSTDEYDPAFFGYIQESALLYREGFLSLED